MRTLAKRRRLVRLYREDHLDWFEKFTSEAWGCETGTVYFIQAGKFVKIGYTRKKDVAARMGELQVGCPHSLRVIATIAGDVHLERDLHRLFRPWRTQGEWFRLSAPGLRQIIERANESLFV
jgi:hypothetical protein